MVDTAELLSIGVLSCWKIRVFTTIRQTTAQKSIMSASACKFIYRQCLSLSLFSLPNGYPDLGNSRAGFSLPSSQCVITYCDHQSFPSPWHCLSAAPSLSGATLLSTMYLFSKWRSVYDLYQGSCSNTLATYLFTKWRSVSDL